MASRYFNILQRRIKKTKKKVKKLEVSTAELREEMNELTNLLENCYQAIVQTREVINPLIQAAETWDTQLLELISAWLGENNGD